MVGTRTRVMRVISMILIVQTMAAIITFTASQPMRDAVTAAEVSVWLLTMILFRMNVMTAATIGVISFQVKIFPVTTKAAAFSTFTLICPHETNKHTMIC